MMAITVCRSSNGKVTVTIYDRRGRSVTYRDLVRGASINIRFDEREPIRSEYASRISMFVHRLVVQGSIFRGNTGIEMANARDGTEFCQPEARRSLKGYSALADFSSSTSKSDSSPATVLKLVFPLEC